MWIRERRLERRACLLVVGFTRPAVNVGIVSERQSEELELRKQTACTQAS